MKKEILEQAAKLDKLLKDKEREIEQSQNSIDEITDGLGYNKQGKTKVLVEYYPKDFWGGRTEPETRVFWLSNRVIIEDFGQQMIKLERERNSILFKIDNLQC